MSHFRQFLWFPILFLILMVGTVMAASEPKLEIVPQEGKWVFRKLHVYQTSLGTVVAGRVLSVNMPSLPAGHIDVAAYDAQGVLIEETTAEYKGGYIAENNRKKGGARFSATLTKPLPDGAVIKLALHKDESENVEKNVPTHEKTLAQ